MFSSKIREFFESDVSLDIDRLGNPTPQETSIAALALLVAVAKEDDDFDLSEIDEITDQLAILFRLDDQQSKSLLDLSSVLNSSHEKLLEFIGTINRCFDDPQKELVLALVWRVIKADGKAVSEETSFAADLRAKLGLSMEQAIRARQMSELDQESFYTKTEKSLDYEDHKDTKILD
jgi:uncharacterized tellurite resistance protein B-like protein